MLQWIFIYHFKAYFDTFQMDIVSKVYNQKHILLLLLIWPKSVDAMSGNCHQLLKKCKQG